MGIVANGTGCVLLDVKTTERADPWAFGKTLGEYDYHCQADHYCEGFAIASGLDVFGMLFAVIERDPPHACAVYAVDDEGLARARAANDEARRTYAQCVADDSWPGYPAGVQVITVPRWAA